MVWVKGGKKQEARGRSKAIATVILLLVFVIGSLLLAFWWFRGWDGQEPVNIVVSSKDRIWVLAVRPQEQRLVEIEVPPTMVVPTSMQGKWQARSLWDLSLLVKDQRVIESVGWDLIGVPVDKSWRIRSWRGEETALWSIFGRVSGSPETLSELLGGVPEKIRLVWFIRGLRENQVKKISLGELSMARRVVDPSGEESVEIDEALLSPLVAEWFEIGEFRRSGLTVAVRNITLESGVGSRLGRQLEHVGMRVISVGNGSGERGIIVAKEDLRKHLAVKKISRWLDLPVSVGTYEERADILVVL